jgi:hypothetical protein
VVKLKESVMSNVMKNSVGASRGKRLRYLSAEKDFEIGEPKELRILRGSASRILWKKGAVYCESEDGIHGYLRGGTGDTPIPCAECKYLNGFEEGDRKVYCSRRCDLFAEGEGFEWKFSIPERAQMNLTRYISGLLQMDLDIPDVVTEVTRIKDSDGLNNYVFAMASKNVNKSSAEEFSGDELQTANILRDMLRADGAQEEIEEFAATLEFSPGLNLSHERALALAEHLSSNGVIK